MAKRALTHNYCRIQFEGSARRTAGHQQRGSQFDRNRGKLNPQYPAYTPCMKKAFRALHLSPEECAECCWFQVPPSPHQKRSFRGFSVALCASWHASSAVRTSGFRAALELPDRRLQPSPPKRRCISSPILPAHHATRATQPQPAPEPSSSGTCADIAAADSAHREPCHREPSSRGAG